MLGNFLVLGFPLPGERGVRGLVKDGEQLQGSWQVSSCSRRHTHDILSVAAL